MLVCCFFVVGCCIVFACLLAGLLAPAGWLACCFVFVVGLFVWLLVWVRAGLLPLDARFVLCWIPWVVRRLGTEAKPTVVRSRVWPATFQAGGNIRDGTRAASTACVGGKPSFSAAHHNTARQGCDSPADLQSAAPEWQIATASGPGRLRSKGAWHENLPHLIVPPRRRACRVVRCLDFRACVRLSLRLRPDAAKTCRGSSVAASITAACGRSRSRPPASRAGGS